MVSEAVDGVGEIACSFRPGPVAPAVDSLTLEAAEEDRPAHRPGTVLRRSGQHLVEAAGVEPDPGGSTKRLMAHDFRRKTLIPRRFSPSIESPGVPCSPLESTPVVSE